MSKSRVVQIINDPHVAYMSIDYPRPTIYCDYRLLIEEEGRGDIWLISAEKNSLEGDLNADDFLSRGFHDVEECTLEVIEESIKGWCLPEFNSCKDIDKKRLP